MHIFYPLILSILSCLSPFLETFTCVFFIGDVQIDRSNKEQTRVKGANNGLSNRACHNMVLAFHDMDAIPTKFQRAACRSMTFLCRSMAYLCYGMTRLVMLQIFIFMPQHDYAMS